ncbi:MAG TPA: hypothetical protein VMF66_14880 [Candidatus Acidoferrum sp.]|nr:hypothetical protein [Candidatus Acidoferrum sp.]
MTASHPGRIVILVAVVVVLLLCAVYLWAPGSVPQGQPPLATLSSPGVGVFQTAFDTDADSPRLVLLLSPT